jgi:hypothetical protein
MGRPRKPAALLELSGAFRKNPDRRRTDEPKDPRALGEPPGRLPVDAIPYWEELANMVGGGVLTFRDRWVVEIAARLMEKFSRQMSAQTVLELARAADLSADEIRDLISREQITTSEINLLSRMLTALGMTPADRSVPTDAKPGNRFAALANEIKRGEFSAG